MTMREGVCPECGGRDIYQRSGWFNNIITMFLPPKTTVLVCGKCGFVTEFIDSQPLEYIRKKWDKYEAGVKRKNDEG